MARSGSRIPLTALVLGLALAGSARADADTERGALIRLIQELDALEPLITEAERQADPAQRVRFAYDWLRDDLARMQAGLREHVERPRTEPQTVEPLRGDYRR
jgi:RAQPRD family integrative conjugative element protein